MAATRITIAEITDLDLDAELMSNGVDPLHQFARPQCGRRQLVERLHRVLADQTLDNVLETVYHCLKHEFLYTIGAVEEHAYDLYSFGGGGAIQDHGRGVIRIRGYMYDGDRSGDATVWLDATFVVCMDNWGETSLQATEDVALVVADSEAHTVKRYTGQSVGFLIEHAVHNLLSRHAARMLIGTNWGDEPIGLDTWFTRATKTWPLVERPVVEIDESEDCPSRAGMGRKA